ncbi:MAG TPA: ribonuclease T [Methylocystis sp.]|nr:ribonuclease T [Methylocystis sp.]
MQKSILQKSIPALAFIVCLACAPKVARAEDCILDRCADKAAPQPSRPSAAPSGDFDFYVLALSWSPGFCEQSRSGSKQCEPGGNLGFVVHGLWPQYEHGFPSDCGGPATVSRIALERARGVYPDEGLARYEWRKHGTCTGLSPGDYFDAAARARNAVTIPDLFTKASADQTLSTQAIEQAFRDANPRLRPGMMGVGCRRDTLEDVRICFAKDLSSFRACPEVARGGCRVRAIRAPAPY